MHINTESCGPDINDFHIVNDAVGPVLDKYRLNFWQIAGCRIKRLIFPVNGKAGKKQIIDIGFITPIQKRCGRFEWQQASFLFPGADITHSSHRSDRAGNSISPFGDIDCSAAISPQPVCRPLQGIPHVLGRKRVKPTLSGIKNTSPFQMLRKSLIQPFDILLNAPLQAG